MQHADEISFGFNESIPGMKLAMLLRRLLWTAGPKDHLILTWTVRRYVRYKTRQVVSHMCKLPRYIQNHSSVQTVEPDECMCVTRNQVGLKARIFPYLAN